MKSLHPAPRAARGFTLIELMVVVVIIGVLAAIALPAYQDRVVSTRRNAAKACILERSQFLERFYTTNLTYVGANPPPCQSQGDLAAFYTFGQVLAARTYTVTATPIGQQLARDTKCGTLSINNTGVKTKTGSESVDFCW